MRILAVLSGRPQGYRQQGERRDCSLRGSDLTGAAFRGARLSQCDLSGANLSRATGLSFAQLTGCVLDARTRLPDSLQPRLNELLTRTQA